MFSFMSATHRTRDNPPEQTEQVSSSLSDGGKNKGHAQAGLSWHGNGSGRIR